MSVCPHGNNSQYMSLSRKSRVKKSVHVMLSFFKRQQFYLCACKKEEPQTLGDRVFSGEQPGEWGRRDLVFFLSFPYLQIVVTHLTSEKKQKQTEKPERSQI